jgi:hypothetical protein
MTEPAEFRDWIDRAKAVRIEAELKHRGITLEGSARKAEWAGACPICGGTDRFSINTKKQVFFCRGCSAKGKGAIDAAQLFFQGHAPIVEVRCLRRLIGQYYARIPLASILALERRYQRAERAERVAGLSKGEASS